jgi:hypothetical protein
LLGERRPGVPVAFPRSVHDLRAVFETWNTGDMDALRELYDPDVIARPPEDWPEGGPWVGRDAVMRQWDQQRETWDTDALVPMSDFIDAADRAVVRFIWRGAGYGPEANLELTNVITVRSATYANTARSVTTRANLAWVPVSSYSPKTSERSSDRSSTSRGRFGDQYAAFRKRCTASRSSWPVGFKNSGRQGRDLPHPLVEPIGVWAER